jgi:hypothetical protein
MAQTQADLTLEFRKTYRNWFKSLSDTFPADKSNIIKYYKAHMDKPPVELMLQFYTQAEPFFEFLASNAYQFFYTCETFYADINYCAIMRKAERGFLQQQLCFLNHLCYFTVLLLADSADTSAYTPMLPFFLSNASSSSSDDDDAMAASKIAEMASAAMAGGAGAAAGGLPKDVFTNPLISSLAEEISKDVKIPESFKNLESPQDIFKLMMNKDGKDFMEEMVKTVSGKIQDKIKNGELSEQDLFAQAQSMMGSVFQNNPMFNNLSSFFGGSGGSGDGVQSEAVVAANEQQRKSDLRKALREKLKNKRH